MRFLPNFITKKGKDEMNIIEKRTDELIPYANNPRKNDGAVDAVANSIREFGFKVPIIIDKDGVIVAGHTRLKAAEKLGIESVPCIMADDLTDEQIKAFRLADNKTNELAEWDEKKLAEELKAFNKEYIQQFGFDDIQEELDELGVTEDDFEFEDEPKETPTAKRGDIYLLGNHRLMCGDSTSEEDVKKLMNGEKAKLVFTDPPYGVAIGTKNKELNELNGGGSIDTNIKNDAIPLDELYKILVKAFTNLRVLVCDDDCSYYVTSPQGGEICLMMMMMMRDAGLAVKHLLIWVKNTATFSLGRLDYDYRHEPIFYTWTKKHNFYGGYSNSVIDSSRAGNIDKMSRAELKELVRAYMEEKPDSIVYCDKPSKSELHPTMKPIMLISRFVINNSKEGEIVADIFGGSGSTLMACEQLNRKCYMMELDEHYVDVIIKRWEDFTGQKAIKVS